MRLASWESRALAQACRLMVKYKYDRDSLSIGNSGKRMQGGPIFKIDRPMTKKFICTTAYKFKNEWNKLPAHIRIIDDREHFNMVIKRYFFNMYLGENTTGITSH